MTTACVFSVDDAYVMPFQVFFHSLEITESIPHGIPIFILHTKSLGDEQINLVGQFLARYQRKATFLDMSDLLPADLPLKESDHVSIASFYRLFIADILPESLDYAVYLDSDMLALRSASSLFREPIHELIGAVDHCSPENGLRIWGPCSGSYFQAGVLIVPLAKWRDLNMSNRFLRVMKNHRDRIKWWDQDILNIAIQDEWQRLPVWYNLCDHTRRFLAVEEILDNAVIIHLDGARKPWNSRHPRSFLEHWDKAYLEVFGQPFCRRRSFVSFNLALLTKLKQILRSYGFSSN
ncbi:glycosyltransferase family 8 protein [Synechococcus sp. CB0205]|uniref:glycosyltransferase family 8 protein n=1 Tax=Synechococcus sp. CB0205 TaxID=232363 RepID=UPI0008FEFB7E|nr:glycosyltransferase family 8 protein [Synechococcus sp. CB0205]